MTLSFATVPSGLQLTVGSTSSTAPFTRTVIQGSRNGLSALDTQTVGGVQYTWQSWSDGGTRAHDVFANASATYTATYLATSADIRVTQSAVLSGTRVTITATGINGGPAAAAGMTLTDTLPSKLTFVSATVPGGSCTYASSTRVVTCPLGTLASGAQAPVTIVTNDNGNGNVSIVARVTTTTADPNTANNTVTTSLRLR